LHIWHIIINNTTIKTMENPKNNFNMILIISIKVNFNQNLKTKNKKEIERGNVTKP